MKGLHDDLPQLLGHHGARVVADLAIDGDTVNVEKAHLNRLGAVTFLVTFDLFVQGLTVCKGFGTEGLE